MQFTKEDKILIKNLFELKGYIDRQLLKFVDECGTYSKPK